MVRLVSLRPGRPAPVQAEPRAIDAPPMSPDPRASSSGLGLARSARFVADEVPVELRRVVEFLNQQMSPAEVLAVEIKQYVGREMKTLVSCVVGQTVEAQQKKTETACYWTS
jgi:hypothetical protein